MGAEEPTEILSGSAPAAGALVAGRYRLDAHIGAGGSADVWSARDERRDRLVTLKILRARDDLELRRQFLAEASRLRTIDHPNVVPVLGILDALGVTLIVFATVAGVALDEHVAASAPLTAREVASIVLQLANALEAIHDRGLVHLDVKPANIVVDADRRMHLIDLGIAEPIGHAPSVIRGTRRYVAPELLRGAPATRAADVYGLALVAREVLLCTSESARVSRVLRRGLDPDPLRRYPRARTLALALAVAVLVDDESSAIRSRIVAAQARIAALASAVRRIGATASGVPGRRTRAVVAYAVAGAFVAALVIPPVVPAVARDASPVSAPLSPATFPLPTIAAYRAEFVAEAPYPASRPGERVDWVVALRNTGSAGWYRGVEGAQAALAPADGGLAAIQTTSYVGPGQIGWFIMRSRAPTIPGRYLVTLIPRIDGLGPLKDLGIYVVITVRGGSSIKGP